MDPEFVYCQLPACPACNSIELRTQRSQAQGDGSRLQWKICSNCDHHFKLVWEPPPTFPSYGKAKPGIE